MSRGGSAPKRDLVRVDLLVFAMALFVAGYAAWSELDYARFESGGQRVEARIERIEKVGSGRRVRHYLHYTYELDGKIYRFDDRDDPDRLEELYTATFNAFTDPDSPLVVGRTFGLLVDRSAPERHRPDRARLQTPWLPHLRTGLALVFLGAITAWLVWARKKSAAPAQGNAPARTRAVTTRSGGKLELRVELDVPWPEPRKEGDGDAALRAKLAAHVPQQRPQAQGAPVTSVRVVVELTPSKDVTLDAVRVELASRSAERDVHTLARSPRLRAGELERFTLELPAPEGLSEIRVVVVDTPSRTFTHTVAT